MEPLAYVNYASCRAIHLCHPYGQKLAGSPDRLSHTPTPCKPVQNDIVCDFSQTKRNCFFLLRVTATINATVAFTLGIYFAGNITFFTRQGLEG